MAIDVEALVGPLSADAPAGPDLSYDSERQQIENAFERGSADDGDAEEIDWRGTIRLITGQAEKTRDLWLPVYLMRAAAQSGQFELLVDAAEWLARLIEERWDDVHPQLDELGFIGRKTPCESLARFADFLRPLGRVPLIEHPRLGRYTGEEFIRFFDEGSGADGFGMFRAMIDAASDEDLQQIKVRLDGLRDAISRTDKVLTAQAEGDTATNFQPTYDAIDRIRRAVAAVLPHEAGAEANAVTTSADDGWGASASTPTASPQGGPSFSGGISSRDDVARAIDAICAYYLRHEPASPVPYALRRAKEWISLDFMAVLEDIAPGGLDEAVRVLKSGRTSDNGLSGWDDSSSAGAGSGASAASSDSNW